MKSRITTKAIITTGKPIYSMHYGVGTSALMEMRGEAQYYHAGSYGWNYDVYDFGEYMIVTGYNVPKKGIKSIPYSIVDEWFNKSTYAHGKDDLNELWKDFEKRIKLL